MRHHELWQQRSLILAELQRNWGSLSRTPLAAVQYQPFQPPGERAPE